MSEFSNERERLTDEERALLTRQTGGAEPAQKALRIIDALAAALEAEKSRRVERRQMNQSLNEQVQRLESRAEALQACVAELEAQDARTAELLAAEHATSIRCQSDLATAKARVAELEAERDDWKKTAQAGCYTCPQEHASRLAAEAALADLRGRVERALVEWERVKRHYQVPMHLCVALELLRGRARPPGGCEVMPSTLIRTCEPFELDAALAAPDVAGLRLVAIVEVRGRAANGDTWPVLKLVFSRYPSDLVAAPVASGHDVAGPGSAE